jgi:DNA repair protein RadC
MPKKIYSNWKSLNTLQYRFRETKEAYPELPTRFKVTSPGAMLPYLKILMEGLVMEVFVIFWLTTNNNVFGFEIISQGSLDSSIVHPREVFRSACVSTAASIILAHNHPSGNPEPSAGDISITKKIAEAGKLLDIPVFDHIIFAGGETYTSFVERRII